LRSLRRGLGVAHKQTEERCAYWRPWHFYEAVEGFSTLCKARLLLRPCRRSQEGWRWVVALTGLLVCGGNAGSFDTAVFPPIYGRHFCGSTLFFFSLLLIHLFILCRRRFGKGSSRWARGLERALADDALSVPAWPVMRSGRQVACLLVLGVARETIVAWCRLSNHRVFVFMDWKRNILDGCVRRFWNAITGKVCARLRVSDGWG